MLDPNSPGAPTQVVMHTAVACRANPGPAGAGILFTSQSGQLLARGFRFVGETTNNEAAYRAILIGLEQAHKRGYTAVAIRTDSQLVVRQLQGAYRVKQPKLQALHAEAVTVLDGAFASWDIDYIPHHQNLEATRLANKALDARTALTT
jgi:ribonuclease HI